MADNDMYTRYGAGFIKSVKLESCNLDSQVQQVHEPTLVINAMVTDRVQSETRGWTERTRDPPNMRLRFKIPVQDLETPTHCQDWVMESLRSAQFKFYVAEIGNPKVLLKELIWNLKEKWVSGETCTGVIEMDVTRVTELRETHPVRIVKTSGNSNAKLFKGEAGESNSSECIMAWLKRKIRCPCWKNRVRFWCGFWLQKKKKSSF